MTTFILPESVSLFRPSRIPTLDGSLGTFWNVKIIGNFACTSHTSQFPGWPLSSKSLYVNEYKGIDLDLKRTNEIFADIQFLRQKKFIR